jgi:hypothetical protein
MGSIRTEPETTMGCVLAIVALVVPRVFLFFAFLMTDWLQRAYETTIWPLLGFLILPYTTIAYMAAMIRNHGSVDGIWLVFVVIAVIVDLGNLGHGEHHRRRRRA